MHLGNGPHWLLKQDQWGNLPWLDQADNTWAQQSILQSQKERPPNVTSHPKVKYWTWIWSSLWLYYHVIRNVGGRADGDSDVAAACLGVHGEGVSLVGEAMGSASTAVWGWGCPSSLRHEAPWVSPPCVSLAAFGCCPSAGAWSNCAPRNKTENAEGNSWHAFLFQQYFCKHVHIYFFPL